VKQTDGTVYFTDQLEAQAAGAARSGRDMGVVMVSDSAAARPSSEFWGGHKDDVMDALPPGTHRPNVVVVRRAPTSGRWYIWDPWRERWTTSTADDVAQLLGGTV